MKRDRSYEVDAYIVNGSHEPRWRFNATCDADQIKKELFKSSLTRRGFLTGVGAARLRLINSQLVDAEQQLDRLCKKIVAPVDGEERENTPGQTNEQRDAGILDSTPGIGRTVLVSLLTEASDALQRRDYHALRAMCGTAPVTKRSGKSHLVLRRQACNRRLRNAVHHWAHNAVLQDATSRTKYEALRAKGHGHARALRSVADRLLNVVCAMLRTGTTFDSSLASKKQANA